jgi:LysM repeat protein
MKRVIYLCLIGFLFGCNAEATPTVVPSLTPMMCLGFTLPEDISCTELDETNAVLQSASENPVTISDGTFTITIRGTVQLRRFSDRFLVNALEGSTVVSVSERTRVLRGQQRLELQIVDGQVQPPEGGAESLADDELTAIAVEMTPHPEATDAVVDSTSEVTEDADNAVDTPDSDENEPEDETTEVVQVTATRQVNVRANISADCEPRSDWNNTYTVQRGDVLELVARDFGSTVQDMALANCLANPGVLAIGQILRVPGERPTLTPSAIAFNADATTLAAGDCTTLRWDVFNVEAVYINDEQTTSTNIRRVCPETTTTYTLRVVYRDDSEINREVTITVNQ